MNRELIAALNNTPFNKLVVDILQGRFVGRVDAHDVPEFLPEGYDYHKLTDVESTFVNLSGLLETVCSKNEMEAELHIGNPARFLQHQREIESINSRRIIVNGIVNICSWSRFPELNGRNAQISPYLGALFVPKNYTKQQQWSVFGDDWPCPLDDFLKDLTAVIHGTFAKPDEDVLEYFIGANHCCQNRCDLEDDRHYISLKDHPNLWQYIWLAAKALSFESRFVAKDAAERDRWMDKKNVGEIQMLDRRVVICETMVGIVTSLLVQECTRLKPSMRLLSSGDAFRVTKGYIIGSGATCSVGR